MKSVNLDELITQKEAAEIRGVTHQSIHLLVKRGRLRTVRIGARRFLLRSEVENFERVPAGRPRKGSTQQNSKASKGGRAKKESRDTTKKSAKANRKRKA